MAFILALLLAVNLTALGWLLIGLPRHRKLAFHQTELVLAGKPPDGSRPRWSIRLIHSLGILPPPNSQLHRDLNLTNLSFTVEDIYVFKTLSVGAGLLLAGLVYWAGEHAIALMLLVMAAAAWGLPDARVRTEAKRVRAEIARDLPPFLQALAMMTEAGMNLHPAVSTYAQQNHAALGRELQLVVAATQMGTPLSEALLDLAHRCDIPELYRAAAALVQASERGGAGLAETCRQLAMESWAKRRDLARELGQKAATKMFLPLLLLVLPTLFLFMIGPALYSMLTSF